MGTSSKWLHGLWTNVRAAESWMDTGKGSEDELVASDEDLGRYRQAGCHCIVGKEVPMRRATDYIKEAYLRLDPMPHCLHPHTLPPHSTTLPSRPSESWTLQQV